MKYIKLFNTHNEYILDEKERPTISYCINQDEIHYDSMFIDFKDPNVKQICVSLWGGADGGSAALNTRVGSKKRLGAEGEMTYYQAEGVSGMTNTFLNNTTIRNFDELQYFTGITSSPSFQGCTLDSVTFPPSITTFRDNTVYSSNIKDLHILSSTINSVGTNCFRSYYATNVYIPNINVFFTYNSTSVESTPLWLATNLYVNDVLTTHIDIPDTVTTLYPWFCSQTIHSITLPNTLTTIYAGAFRKMQLSTLTIPASVTSMGASILYNTTLPELIMLPTTPPTIASNTFTNSTITVIKVPTASVDSYKSATYWSSLASKIQAIT